MKDVLARNHAVTFYRDDLEMDREAAKFLFHGLGDGKDAVIIASAKRQLALIPRLVQFGFGWFHNSPRLLVYDAESLLSSFMVDGVPDEDLFRSLLTPIFAKLRPQASAYDEMLDILARRGEFLAAIRLEEMWNREMTRRDFSLFCGYSLGSFGGNNRRFLEEIRAAHSHCH